jgi:hypothetical protein
MPYSTWIDHTWLSVKSYMRSTMHQGTSLLKVFAEIQTAGFATQKYRNSLSSSGDIFRSMGEGIAAGIFNIATVD